MNKWDKYFLNICKSVATNSKCLSRQIGAIIVKDKSIISTGYNGPPRGIPECDLRYINDGNLKTLLEKSPLNKPVLIKENDKIPPSLYPKGYIGVRTNICPRQVLGYKSGEGLGICIAGHAERNALINAARNGINVKDASIYMDCPIPCKDCLIEIINAGIGEIVCTSLDYYDETSKYIKQNSNLIIRSFH